MHFLALHFARDVFLSAESLCHGDCLFFRPANTPDAE